TRQAPQIVHNSSATTATTITVRSAGRVQKISQNIPGPRTAITARNTAHTSESRANTTRAPAGPARPVSAVSTPMNTTHIMDSSTGKCQDKNAENAKKEA